MKTKAVIYARVSSSNDRQDTTRQIEDLRKYAVSQNIEIVNVFQEHISGAKKNEERQVLTDCLNYCTTHSVNYLLLSELSRLGRSTLQVLRSLEVLHEAKVSVHIQNLGLYTLQADGKVNPIVSVLTTMLAEMGNIERSNISLKAEYAPGQMVQAGVPCHSEGAPVYINCHTYDFTEFAKIVFLAEKDYMAIRKQAYGF